MISDIEKETVKIFLEEYLADPFYWDRETEEDGVKFIPLEGLWKIVYSDGTSEYYNAYTGAKIGSEKDGNIKVQQKQLGGISS